MGDYENEKPTELKRAYYHRWGFKKQDGAAPKPQGKKGDNDIYRGFKDTIKELGHEKLDMINIFVSMYTQNYACCSPFIDFFRSFVARKLTVKSERALCLPFKLYHVLTMC